MCARRLRRGHRLRLEGRRDARVYMLICFGSSVPRFATSASAARPGWRGGFERSDLARGIRDGWRQLGVRGAALANCVT